MIIATVVIVIIVDLLIAVFIEYFKASKMPYCYKIVAIIKFNWHYYQESKNFKYY